MHNGQLAVKHGDPLIYMATTSSGWKKGRVSVALSSGHVIQQFGDADDKTEAGERLKDPHAIAVSPGCKSVVVPELSARIAHFSLAAQRSSGAMVSKFTPVTKPDNRAYTDDKAYDDNTSFDDDEARTKIEADEEADGAKDDDHDSADHQEDADENSAEPLEQIIEHKPE